MLAASPLQKKQKTEDMLSAMTPANQQLLVKKLSATAQLPKRGSEGAAGYDLCS